MNHVRIRSLARGCSVALLALTLAVGMPAAAGADESPDLLPRSESAPAAGAGQPGAPSTGLMAASPSGAYANQPWPWRSVAIGDSGFDTTGSASTEIRDASVRYNPQTGRVDWQIRLDDTASATVRYSGFLGHWNVSDQCVADIELAHYGTQTLWFAGSASGAASYQVADAFGENGNVVLLGASTGSRSTAINCAYTRTMANPAPPVYDTAGAVGLAIPAQPRPALQVTAPGVRKGKKGKKVKLKVRVANPSSAAAPSTVAVVTGGKPARKTYRLGTLAPRAARTIVVRAKIGAKPRKVTVRASATGATTVARTIIVRPKAPKRPKPKPKPVKSGGGSLAGRYFWHTESGFGVGWVNDGLAFIDKKWAYIGFPPAGLPKCKRQTSVDGGEGCARYSWNKRTGALRIGKLKGKYRGGMGLSLDQKGYSRLALPKPRTKLAFSLYRKDFSGCMASPYCVTWTTYLSFDKAGRFVRSGTMLGSIGSPLTTQTWAATSNSDKGTYRIGKRGLVTLSYADGKTVNSTLGIAYRKGKPDPREGVMLGDENYYD